MNNCNEKPLVSVACIVYNHEPFLHQCLDGFMMQETSFPFEVLVHDDASTDNSTAIIKEYEKRYPGIIKPIYQSENQYSKGGKILASFLLPKVTGKYVAICEGDDYWTDNHKLQKQVDYMETHPDCTFCFHNGIIHREDGSEEDKIYENIDSNRDYTGLELQETAMLPTASYLFRSTMIPSFIQMIHSHPLIKVGDLPLVVLCSKFGKCHGFSEVMCVYRKHSGGWTNFCDAKRTFEDARSWEERRIVYGPEYKELTTSTMTGLYLNALIRAIREYNVPIFFKAFYRGIVRQPITAVKALIRIPKERRERKKI